MPDPTAPLALERRSQSSDAPDPRLPAAQPQPQAVRLAAARRRRVLIIVENLPCPFDRRVWQEARTLNDAGYIVSIICPKGKGFEADHEVLDGVHVYRHPMPPDGHGALGYLREYSAALWHALRLAFRVRRERGVDVLQGCNPPDLVFLVAWALRPFGVAYLFDHHDVCPELYETKFGRRGALWRCMRARVSLCTFSTAASAERPLRIASCMRLTQPRSWANMR